MIILPERTDTNIRFYSDDDLKRSSMFPCSTTTALKYPKSLDLTDAELNQQVKALSDAQTDPEIHIDQLVVAMVDSGRENLNISMDLSSAMALSIPSRRSFTRSRQDRRVVANRKCDSCPEHFISNLIRQKLIAAIDALPLPHAASPLHTVFRPIMNYMNWVCCSIIMSSRNPACAPTTWAKWCLTATSSRSAKRTGLRI